MKIYNQSFPRRSFNFTLGGVAFLAIFIGLTILLSKGSQPFDVVRFIDKGNPKLVIFYFLCPVVGVWMFWAGRDVFGYLSGKRPSISIDKNSFTLNEVEYAFSDVRSFVYNYGEDELLVFMRSNQELMIRGVLFKEFDAIHEEFVSRTEPRLMREAQELLSSGQPVSFGKKVKLSRADLEIKRKTISFAEIKKARIFRGNDNGAAYEQLVVELSNGKKVEIETRFIENVGILLQLISEMSPNMKSGV